MSIQTSPLRRKQSHESTFGEPRGSSPLFVSIVLIFTQITVIYHLPHLQLHLHLHATTSRCTSIVPIPDLSTDPTPDLSTLTDSTLSDLSIVDKDDTFPGQIKEKIKRYSKMSYESSVSCLTIPQVKHLTRKFALTELKSGDQLEVETFNHPDLSQKLLEANLEINLNLKF